MHDSSIAWLAPLLLTGGLFVGCGPAQGPIDGTGSDGTDPSASSTVADGSATGETTASSESGADATDTGDFEPVRLELVATIRGGPGERVGAALAVWPGDEDGAWLAIGAPNFHDESRELVGALFGVRGPLDEEHILDGTTTHLRGTPQWILGRSVAVSGSGWNASARWVVGTTALPGSSSVAAAFPTFDGVVGTPVDKAATSLGGWVADAADWGGATFGLVASAVGDVDGDGSDDFVVSGNLLTCESERVLLVHVVPGGATGWIDVDPTNSPAHGFPILAPCSFAQNVLAAAPIGDLDGDGFAEVLLSLARDGEGVLAIVFGGDFERLDLADAGADAFGVASIQGELVYAMTAGDVTGNGARDLILGTPPYRDSAGRVWVLDDVARLASAGGPEVVELADEDMAFVIDGAYRGDVPVDNGHLGQSIAVAGDVNTDGVTDIIVGTAGLENRAYVVFGAPSIPSVDVMALADEATGIELEPPEGAAEFGWAVDGGIDLTDNGHSNVLVGAPSATGGGAVYIFGRP